MWIELVQNVTPHFTFNPPAEEQSLLDIEAALGLALPPEFRALLLESNGIADDYGKGIMSAESIINFNLYMRSDQEQGDLYMSFDSLFCFAEEGNGNMFFYPVQGNGRINNPFIFHWDHETDSRRYIANSLEDFATGWYSRTLEV